MRRLIVGFVVVLVLLVAGVAIATWRLSRPKLDEQLRGDPAEAIVIAPLDDALTFARIDTGEGLRVVLVTGADAGGLDVVDLEEATGRRFRDGIEAWTEMGHGVLAALADEAGTTRTELAALALPFDTGGHHVAAGTNFRGHAEEVGREEGPFLFPKLATPTPWHADVAARGRLDYEAEICAVTLATHTASEPAPLGYVLCNDFTDRWMLVREMDMAAPMGVTGFPDGKGGDGMLPIGPLLAVPRDADAFYRDVELSLWVDGALRQRAAGGRMIWSPAEIADRALEACEVDFQRRAGSIRLTDCAGIPARTLP